MPRHYQQTNVLQVGAAPKHFLYSQFFAGVKRPIRVPGPIRSYLCDRPVVRPVRTVLIQRGKTPKMGELSATLSALIEPK